jgi:uncharacterized Zn finger protein
MARRTRGRRSYRYDDEQRWPAYVPVADRQAKAKRETAALAKKGRTCRPVAVAGRKIAASFWGRAWCDNLEGYSDYENRLPRGRSYVCNGLVIDLAIEPGRVSALVSGSSLYEVEVTVKPQPAASWAAIVRACTGQIGSLVDLLQGRLSEPVMQLVSRQDGGLFPSPREIRFRCTCPDGAFMCKHVAAALYGVGARLDEDPALLFRLRHVDPEQLILSAAAPPQAAPAGDGGLAGADLSALFGIEIEATPQPAPAPQPRKPATRAPASAGRRRKTGAAPPRE